MKRTNLSTFLNVILREILPNRYNYHSLGFNAQSFSVCWIVPDDLQDVRDIAALSMVKCQAVIMRYSSVPSICSSGQSPSRNLILKRTKFVVELRTCSSLFNLWKVLINKSSTNDREDVTNVEMHQRWH